MKRAKELEVEVELPDFSDWLLDDRDFSNLVRSITKKAYALFIKQLREDAYISLRTSFGSGEATLHLSAFDGQVALSTPLDDEAAVWADRDYADPEERTAIVAALRRAADKIEGAI